MSPEGKERPDAQQQLGLNPTTRPSTRQKQGAPAMRSSSWG